jgi:hypothetical protein
MDTHNLAFVVSLFLVPSSRTPCGSIRENQKRLDFKLLRSRSFHYDYLDRQAQLWLESLSRGANVVLIDDSVETTRARLFGGPLLLLWLQAFGGPV